MRRVAPVYISPSSGGRHDLVLTAVVAPLVAPRKVPFIVHVTDLNLERGKLMSKHIRILLRAVTPVTVVAAVPARPH